MALVLDTGPIVAFLNSNDPDHESCKELIEQTTEDLVIADPVLVEVDYWMAKLAGPKAWSEFAADVVDGAYRLEHIDDNDLRRAGDIEVKYADLQLGFVDASIVAVCERLGEKKLATLDRRHFAVVRPRHCKALTLLPA
ncbi:MAG: type II toxin-antitoxin system VapC family toxin [Actinomycetota bacterium]